jgi:hypothetical protein
MSQTPLTKQVTVMLTGTNPNPTAPPHAKKTCKKPMSRPPFLRLHHCKSGPRTGTHIIKFCSDTCRNQKTTAPNAAPEQAISPTLLAERTADGNRVTKPSALRSRELVAGDPRNKTHAARRDWEPSWNQPTLPHGKLAKCVAFDLDNRPVDPATAKGPIRLQLR